MLMKMANHILCLLLMIAVGSCVVLSAVDLCEPEQGYDLVISGIKENVNVGEVIGEIKIPGNEEQVTLEQSENDLFDFNTTTRKVVVKSELDADSQFPGFSSEFSITCSEVQSSQKISINVKIFLSDVNDNPPQFTQEVYYLNISEGLSLQDAITTGIRANDRDSGSNGRVIYSILPGEFSDYFDIEDKLNTVLHLKKKLDYETIKTMTIEILARDQPNNETPLNSTCKLILNIQDEDDQIPQFSEKSYTGSVKQNSARGTVVVVSNKIQATDPDITINSPVKYSLLDGNALFDINPDTAEVTVLTPPTSGEYNYLIKATQVDNALRQGTALLKIQVTETDSNPPKFERETYMVTVPESTPVMSTILTVSASDKDFRDSLTFQILDTKNKFEVNPISGHIVLQEALDYEIERDYDLSVTVTDGTFTATCTVQVRVSDVNDNDPSILNRQIEVPAERRTGAILAELEASDLDAGTRLTFKLLNHQDLFVVSDEGVVSIIGLEDELKESRYDLVIEISDNGDVPRTISVLVVVKFPSPPSTGPVVMAGTDDTLAIVFGVLAAIMFIVIILLIIYIIRKRQQNNEDLDQHKLNRSLDPKGLKFQSHQSSLKNSNRININYHGNVDETSDGATTIQENPFNDDHINYGYVHSDSETDRDMDEIHIETAVIPYDAYSNATEVYRDAGPMSHTYENGSLSTFKDSGSMDSVNSESINSKKALMGNSKRPAMHMLSWDSNGNVPSMQSMQSFDPDTSVTPVEEKPEITVYF